MNRLPLRIAIAALALSVPIAGVSVAHADPTADNGTAPLPAASIVDHAVTAEELTLAEQRSEHLFSVLLTEQDGTWTVNSAQAQSENVESQVLTQIADILNDKPTRTQRHAVNSEGYRNCVLNAVGLGGLTGGAAKGGSQLAYLIATKNWKEVAWVLGRLVGVNALKGGVAGATAALVGAGAWCATPFAG
ncbi:hypothetical protein ACFWNH_28925 [Rhodococcus qingshengii]|uniref:hypothetical protein n=1 Tax=Rhodococcus qingshengii TaxID=334542 RepID=UPI00364B135C